VWIERADVGREWHFACYRWLDYDKDDLCPYRTLTPSQPDSFHVGEAQMQVRRGSEWTHLMGLGFFQY
jgi:hypothetical protein